MPVLIRPMFLFVLICTIKHMLRPYRWLVPDCFFRSDVQEPSHSPEDSRLPLAKKYRHKTLKPQHVFFTIWLLYRLNKWDWNWQNPTSCFHFFGVCRAKLFTAVAHISPIFHFSNFSAFMWTRESKSAEAASCVLTGDVSVFLSFFTHLAPNLKSLL